MRMKERLDAQYHDPHTSIFLHFKESATQSKIPMPLFIRPNGMMSCPHLLEMTLHESVQALGVGDHGSWPLKILTLGW